MKRFISLMIVVALMLSLSTTAFATNSNANILEAEVADDIEEMVSWAYFGQPGQYEIGDAVAIYNADTVCVYYILPVFCNQECIGIVEIDTSGNFSLSDESILYNEISELSTQAYLLYNSGGIVYAAFPDETVELYDSGYDIPVSSDFASLPYVDKATEIQVCLEDAATYLDINAVVAQVELVSATEYSVAPLSEVPALEVNECSIATFVTQGDYNLCWAACVATIANYKKGLSLSAKNVAVAMGHDYTAEGYLGATLSETVSALSRYSLSYSYSSGKLSWANVKSNITNNRPFIVRIYSESIKNGHMLTGYGYGCRSGDSETYASSRYVQVWDPNGSKRTLTYQNSTYSIGGNYWTWTHTLTD